MKLCSKRASGFEPPTSSLGSWHSTTELRPQTRFCTANRRILALQLVGRACSEQCFPNLDCTTEGLAWQSTATSVRPSQAVLHRDPGRWPARLVSRSGHRLTHSPLFRRPRKEPRTRGTRGLSSLARRVSGERAIDTSAETYPQERAVRTSSVKAQPESKSHSRQHHPRRLRFIGWR
jgi:hypothetical protein